MFQTLFTFKLSNFLSIHVYWLRLLNNIWIHWFISLWFFPWNKWNWRKTILKHQRRRDEASCCYWIYYFIFQWSPASSGRKAVLTEPGSAAGWGRWGRWGQLFLLDLARTRWRRLGELWPDPPSGPRRMLFFLSSFGVLRPLGGGGGLTSRVRSIKYFNNFCKKGVGGYCSYLVQPHGAPAVVTTTGTDPLLTNRGVALDESLPCHIKMTSSRWNWSLRPFCLRWLDL